MSHIEEALLRRWSGVKIMRMSLAFGAAGILPLLVYIAVGPKDGNPIGLGLLAGLAVTVAGMGVLVGVLKFCVDSGRKPKG